MTNSESTAAKPEATEVNEFEAVRKRLEEIVREVDDDDISLDDALDLYEEAVKLGLQASSLLEVGITPSADPVEAQSPAPAGESETPAPDQE